MYCLIACLSRLLMKTNPYTLEVPVLSVFCLHIIPISHGVPPLSWLRPILSQILRKAQKVMENHQQKKRRVMVESNQDHINKLPNCILSTIISSLKIKEAVRTSAVSTEWRYMWTTPTNLILDADNILEEEHYSVANIFHLSDRLRYIIKMNRTFAFINNVNHFLSGLSEFHKIEKLKVCFTFRRNRYDYNLHRWISIAVNRNVEVIDLCLLEENQLSAPINDGALYVFPCDVVGNGSASGFKSCLKCLRLAHCVFAPHRTYFSGFTTLTTLDLIKVDLISGEHIQLLLSSCHNLEWLSFSECYNMDYLKIEHPFCQKLKYLNVNLCRQLKAIELKGTNLETLEYKGCKIDFLFYNSPKLKTVFSHVSESTASHSEIWPVFSLPIALPQLETLFLECSCYMAGIMRNRLPTFPNLRHLIVIKVAILRQDLSWIANVLKACPTLRRLELHLRTYLYINEELRKTSWPPRCPHNHLKEVVITGISSHSSEIEIAIYLLKNASALEKMTVDPRPRIYLGHGKWGLSEACENWSSGGRQKVYEHLMQEVCPPVELLIL